MSSETESTPGSVSNNPRGVRLVGAAAGIGSGLTKVAVGHGFDTIKTRLQCSPTGTYRGAIDCLLKTVRQESFFALYKGALPPALGWSFIDSVLLGSLHNYRLFFMRHGLTESAMIPSTGVGTEFLSVSRLTLSGHAVAGLCAGLTSAFVATPVELLKVKLQLQLQRSAADRQFQSPLDCARQIMRHQGVSGMWTGLTGSLVFRSNFFWMFGGIELLMRQFSKLRGTPYEISTEMSSFLAGGFASLGFWFFAIPADNVKNRQMAASFSSPRASFAKVARRTFHSDGIKGFYRGMTPTILRAFPTNASAYFAYEAIMKLLSAEKTRI